ncbi:hypothetical protein LI328DRAFT_135636 [Trichoderma asperelloides]|nr:hypothetical protein LI328DRAFT_135636 [Trichoderma asperelloides]
MSSALVLILSITFPPWVAGGPRPVTHWLLTASSCDPLPGPLPLPPQSCDPHLLCLLSPHTCACSCCSGSLQEENGRLCAGPLVRRHWLSAVLGN